METFADIERLREGLAARIVLLPRKEHQVQTSPKGYSGINEDNYIEFDTVTDQEEIAVDDFETRRRARKKLQGLYDSCEKKTVRYLAGRALGKAEKDLKHEFGRITSMKIWAYDNPGEAVAAALLTGAAGLGLGYFLIEYFSSH